MKRPCASISISMRTGDLANARSQSGGRSLALLAHAAVEKDVVRGADAVLVRERIELQRGMAGIDDGPNLLHHALVGGEIAAVRMGVEQDVVAYLAAEQVVDRLAQHLAADVPKRDVDTADHVRRGAARAGVGERAECLVPQPFDVRRVLADEKLVELTDDARDSAVGDPGRRGDLAPAGDALVGADLDEEVFAPESAHRLHQPWHQLGDFHGFVSSSTWCTLGSSMGFRRLDGNPPTTKQGGKSWRRVH